MASLDAVVDVSNLTKTYPGAPPVNAVVDFSLSIARGEVFALLGPNGAGKSTVIEILEGFRSRSGGQVSVLGVDPAKATREWRARLGIVRQSIGDAGTSTVREAVRHFASMYPRRRDPDEVIAVVGLAEKADVRITKLSGGQQRRVDVALGIIGAPELLFLDEPTTGFDPEARRQFWQLIRELQHDGTTMVLTTHYLDEAAELSDRAGVINKGRLIALGPVAELGTAEERMPVVRWRDSQGLQHQERTHEPGRLVHQLAADQEPIGLEVIRPSLEDIYLDLIGRDENGDLKAAS